MTEDRFHLAHVHAQARMLRLKRAAEFWAQVRADNQRPVDEAGGTAFREQLERRITADAERRHAISTAPDEVIHRRVDGQTVIGRRLLTRRTIADPNAEGA